MRALYMVGGPGTGKSTLMSSLTAGMARVASMRDDGGPKREWLFRSRPGSADDVPTPLAVELGARRARFPGTDAMSMSAIVGVEEWITSGIAAAEAPVLLGEGARLGVLRFLKALLTEEIETRIVYVTCATETSDRRRYMRGSKQAAPWVCGAFTRAANFVAMAEELMLVNPLVTVHDVCTDEPLGENVDKLREIIGW